ncbi:hypothetical protein K458DRAFT_110993 [Lentithecium fluviatile CBS 122367]|uniref:Uncharacterized protein n=1 Tax=Lentithecium fluviatile CBS 122367 TaxID=1168545 RepID=A0A6G1IQ71_9PLEO|nr:hypothetical protein K458DRAFT_110993 [Lentithecium fluviatile CBS 122367]
MFFLVLSSGCKVGRPVQEAAGGSSGSQPRLAVLLGASRALTATEHTQQPSGPRKELLRRPFCDCARSIAPATRLPTRLRPPLTTSPALLAAISRCTPHGSPFTASEGRGLAWARPDPNDPAAQGPGSTTEKTQEVQIFGKRHQAFFSLTHPQHHHPSSCCRPLAHHQ